MGTGGHSDSNKFQPSGDQPAPSSRLSCSRLRWWRDLGSPPPGARGHLTGPGCFPSNGQLPKGQHGSDQASPAAAHTGKAAPSLNDNALQAALCLQGSLPMEGIAPPLGDIPLILAACLTGTKWWRDHETEQWVC